MVNHLQCGNRGFFDEGDHQLLHDQIHLGGGEVVEYRLLELIARDGALPYLHLIVKNALVGPAQHGTLLGTLVVGSVQVVDEHE